MRPFSGSDCLKPVTEGINRAFGAKEPWQVATITATTVLGGVWLWTVICQDESELVVSMCVIDLLELVLNNNAFAGFSSCTVYMQSARKYDKIRLKRKLDLYKTVSSHHSQPISFISCLQGRARQLPKSIKLSYLMGALLINIARLLLLQFS